MTATTFPNPVDLSLRQRLVTITDAGTALMRDPQAARPGNRAQRDYAADQLRAEWTHLRDLLRAERAPLTKGHYTVVMRDGGHLTFKVAVWKSRPERLIVKLFTGRTNEDDAAYEAFADVAVGGTGVRLWRDARQTGRVGHRDLSDVLEGLAILLAGDRAAFGKAYALVCGRCYVCNRLLTHPESVESGIGPECAGRR